MGGTIKKLIVIILLALAACSPIVSDDRIFELELEVARQREVINSITGHFVDLSNDYTLLERRVEALEE